MMIRLRGRRSHAAIAAAAMVALLAAFAAPAQASRTAGWRIVKVIGTLAGDNGIDEVTATGPADAWAVGTICSGSCASPRLLIEHFNGTGWTRIAPPNIATGATAIAASSPVNVWMFATGRAGHRYLLHWTGRWAAAVPLPSSVDILKAFVFSRKDAWAFGLHVSGPKAGQPYDLRYNGHAWRQVKEPAADDFWTASSATDIWTSGRGRDVWHWTGKSWRKVSFPKLRAPKGLTAGANLSLALSATNVWAQYGYSSKTGCCSAGGLLHWNGTKWRRVAIPHSIAYFASNVVQDGRGGLWLEGGKGETAWLFDYRDGRWSRSALPGGPSVTLSSLSLAWIPRTASVWGGASISPVPNHGAWQAVIIRYGS